MPTEEFNREKLVPDDLQIMAMTKPEEAEPKLKEILINHPDNQEAVRSYASCLADLVRYKEAIELAENNFQENPKNSEAGDTYMFAIFKAHQGGKSDLVVATGNSFLDSGKEHKGLKALLGSLIPRQSDVSMDHQHEDNRL